MGSVLVELENGKSFLAELEDKQKVCMYKMECSIWPYQLKGPRHRKNENLYFLAPAQRN